MDNIAMTSACPLCKCNICEPFFQDKKRQYLRCSHCELVFVPRCYWLNSTSEKAIYDLHQNSPHDEGYRNFLSRLTSPLLKILPPNQKGLDFGCGPGPALPCILEEKGHHVDLYDPFYQDDSSLLLKTYDFICATEVVEHLHNPSATFTLLFQLLKQRGWLGIMTKMVIDKHSFQTWHYIRDMTHICFFNRSTFEYIAQRFNAKFTLFNNDVILFEKM